MTTVTTMYMLVAVIFSSLLHQYVRAEEGKFYGGSMSYTMEKQTDGTNLVIIELITGWVLGKGPCGPGCNSSDIGRSTSSTRQLMTKTYSDYLGTYTVDYINKTTAKTETPDMNAQVLSTYDETVLAVSEDAKWEQDLLHFNFVMPAGVEKLDVNFDGKPWRKLTLQQGTGRWHFQTTVSTAKRSDTGKTNQSPRSLAKPFYRVKLGIRTEIRIPAVDADDDFIKCGIADFVEGGDIAIYPPPNVQVFENCSVHINASESDGYTDDSWVAVPVSVRDFNKEKIVYGTDDYMPAKFSMSATAVQFVVQVLANLITPEFVEPTLEGNHIFIMYADTTWRTEIYAEAPENTTLEAFSAFGIQREALKLSSLKQDTKRPQVKYAIMSWKPSLGEIGRHIACVSARDSTRVDSAEERCFILDVQVDAFNHTTKVTAGKPYFVDIPSPDQFVNCKIDATCVVAIYVKSTVEVVDIHVTESYIDKYKLGPIESVTHKGEPMYQTDLFFEHSLHGKENICFLAKDKNGGESENVCIQSKIEPPDPCVSAPCLNSATCKRDEDTGGFICLCLSGFSGKTCEIKEDKCKPNPCVQENSQICAGIGGILCYCNPGFSGDICDKNIDDCNATACNGHGSCRDKVNGFDCECFSRYGGKYCTVDKCSIQAAGIMSCPAAGCNPNLCQGGGVCLQGGICSCPYGYSGNSCETRTCDISGSVTGVDIISPSSDDGSKIICYTQGDTISSCKTRIYLAVKSGSKPKITIETTRELQSNVNAGLVAKLSVLPGISTMYSTDVTISGNFNSTKSHYICVQASAGASTSKACYELSFMPNPESDTKTLAYLQRNARIKFVQPTLKDQSRILCKSGEKCHVLLYTSIASSRPTCVPSSTSTSGSFTGCDKDDKDNDQYDPDSSAKTADPCCKDVISSAADVTVFKAHPRGPSCVTEASFTFASAGEKDICFQSANTDYQQVCYKVGVYDSTSDPCSSSPCLNNGHCFHMSHNNFKCICAENYNGDKCEKGPCQPADNHCQNGAYCQTNNGVDTCICKAGYSGQTCNKDPSSLNKLSAEFTDTAKPSVFSCVIRQKCSIALLLTGQSAQVPTVSPGYVDSSLLLDEIETVDRSPVQNFYQTNIKLKPLELGEKDMCIQTKDVNGVNKDELCFKVNVVSDVISIYGFKDRPHFIEPSMPTNTEVECLADQPCHVLYHVTPGTGNENECITFHPHPPTDFVNYHLFSTCENCNPGGPGNGNCTVDVSVVNTNADVSAARHFCLSVGLKGSSVEGENRCFDVTVKDQSTVGKTGCQNLECNNGGFCDGHDPAQPVCYCQKGFSGTTCEKAEVNSPITSAQKQTLIGDFAVPTEIKCVVNQSCSIPFQIISKSGITPSVSLGFNDPRLVAETPKWEALGSSSTEFQGYALVHPNAAGDFQLCLQASLNSLTDDEFCVKVEVINETVDKTDKTKPYFLQPTIETDSTVLCEVKKSCHFDMHFTKGDMFSFVGRCPTLTETSPSPVEGVHIFDGKIQATDCTADISYVPPLADGDHKLCLQVALPGKKGENRCYTIKVVNDVKTEVISPCRAVTCEHDGKCVADFTSTPAKSSCICTSGFAGTDCKTVVDKNKDLPGVVNLNGTSSGNQHFEINYAIPTDVHCEENTDCCINTPYHGDTDKPPKIGYKDSNLVTSVQKVLQTSSSDTSLHIAQTCFKGPKGPHRICQQTTTNGTEQGVNIDEVCTNITIGPKTHYSGTTDPYFKTDIPDGSKVLCQPNTVCHNTVFTAKQSDGQCSQVRECGNGVRGVHVFQTSLISDVCTTDVAVKTGNSGTLDLCISTGSGGEEKHLEIEVESKTGFGPCQELHCLNGGSCIANLATNPTCHCLAGYTGLVCETDIDDCSTNPCKNEATCVDKVNSYTCYCVTGYTGRDCETKSCLCVHGQCHSGLCICSEGWSGKNCNNRGGSRTHTGIQTATDQSPPAFTEFVIPQIIRCKINKPCTIILPVDGKPGQGPTVEHGDYDHELSVTTPIQVKNKYLTCNTGTRCPYEAWITVSPPQIKLYKYCVQTKDYQSFNADELCYKIQGVQDETTPPGIFNYPPTLPENSTMSCSHEQTCHYQLEVKKNQTGPCDPNLSVEPTSSPVAVLQSSLTNSSFCNYDVVYIPSKNSAGKQNLCFSTTSSVQKHCMVVDVKDDCDTKKASEQAREMVTKGYASCFCIVNSKKVQIIKKRPVVQKGKLFKAAGFGAGGMAGTMVLGVAVYALVNKLRQPTEKKKPPTPRPLTPSAGSARQKSRVHPQRS
ncbi:uncharacterized protein LOC128547113 [Mercenaria mercenaria]|uniref:uncharacterized protein LOC128547113 n=1 Tax=Mercenaria mercenaria TaxID=6596 RepID=UPI00234F5D67|nr:uncharacterized protein LOC128547113 [Mercenaria mercenaria]